MPQPIAVSGSPTMTRPRPRTLYRIGAVAGVGGALILLINAAKRADVIPTTAFTQLVAPLAQILALALVTALYFAYGRSRGTFGLVAYLLNAFALAALVGVEFVINLVFNELPTDTIDALRDGPLGIALTVASILFLLGTLAFVASLLGTGQVSVTPLAMYALGAVPVSLRAFVPEAALDIGLALMAGGIGWISLALLEGADRIPSWGSHQFTDMTAIDAS